jgi:hypothetical protein
MACDFERVRSTRGLLIDGFSYDPIQHNDRGI